MTLLTDFGRADTYVGQLKGAVLTVCSGAQLVDLTHEIPPGDLLTAAIAWADAVSAFPAGTIHLAVVDPGVGSSRRAIAAEIGDWRFVCPDNGLLTVILQKWTRRRIVELTNSQFWRPEVSPVFHGRDLFGPVAGHWARGTDLAEFGPELSLPPVLLSVPQPVNEGHAIRGQVLMADHFGTLRTNIPATWLADDEDWTIEVAGITIRGLVRCFSDVPPGELCALMGSHGDLEITMNQGRAQDKLSAGRGMPVFGQRTKV